MPLPIAHAKRRIAFGLASSLGFAILAAGQSFAQTPPETLRIDVKPAKPGIRSITIDRKYRPIISRDDAGVVIDTLGSAQSLPPCEVELQVTLENSRVLNRGANICSGGTLVVDVENDGKPGQARVIGGTAGAVSSSDKPDAPKASVVPSTSESNQAATSDNSTATEPGASAELDDDTINAGQMDAGEDPANDSLMKPLDQVDTPFGDTPTTGDGNFEAMVGDSLSRHPDDQTPTQREQGTGISSFRTGDIAQYAWYARTGNYAGGTSYLTHGITDTDHRDFLAACTSQSGQATVVLAEASPNTTEGLQESVVFSAGDFNRTYSAVGSSANNKYGTSFPQIVVPMTDPLWQALIRESTMTVQVDGRPAYDISLHGSAQQVRLFVATCAEPQQVVGEDGSMTDGMPGGEQPHVAADYSCSEAGRVHSLEGDRPGQIVFRNQSNNPVDINWVGYDGGTRYFATLQPGQLLEQQTYVTHVWMVRETAGPCLGLFVSNTPYREVVIGGGSGARGRALDQDDPSFGFPEVRGPAGPLPPANIDGHRTFGEPAAQQPQALMVANYLCTAGVDLQVTFAPDQSSVTVAEMGVGTVRLPRVGGASSFSYADRGYSLTGQIQNATWTRPGQRDVFCARRH